MKIWQYNNTGSAEMNFMRWEEVEDNRATKDIKSLQIKKRNISAILIQIHSKLFYNGLLSNVENINLEHALRNYIMLNAKNDASLEEEDLQKLEQEYEADKYDEIRMNNKIYNINNMLSCKNSIMSAIEVMFKISISQPEYGKDIVNKQSLLTNMSFFIKDLMYIFYFFQVLDYKDDQYKMMNFTRILDFKKHYHKDIDGNKLSKEKIKLNNEKINKEAEKAKNHFLSYASKYKGTFKENITLFLELRDLLNHYQNFSNKSKEILFKDGIWTIIFDFESIPDDVKMKFEREDKKQSIFILQISDSKMIDEFIKNYDKTNYYSADIENKQIINVYEKTQETLIMLKEWIDQFVSSLYITKFDKYFIKRT